jgi:Domain of unknown function (DUF1707)
MSLERPMRASDQDRHEAVLALSDCFADGRLDRDEFDRRMGLAEEATYLHDLDPLFADLPSRTAPLSSLTPPARTVARPAWPEARRRHPGGRLPFLTLLLLVVVTLVLLGHGAVLWLAVPALWFAVAARHHHRRAAMAHHPSPPGLRR